MKKRVLIIISLINLILMVGCNNININSEKSNLKKIDLANIKIIKPNLKSDENLNKDVINFYKEWESKYIKKVRGVFPEQTYLDYGVEAREDSDALQDWFKPFNVVATSESQGYAMIITASMANIDKDNKDNFQKKFNALYRFFRAHPSKYNRDLMCLQELGIGLEKNGSIVEGEVLDIENTTDGPYSSIEGDMDIAYSLLIANEIWGSDGEIDYRSEGLKVIKAIMNSEINRKEHIPLMGDWVLKYASGRNPVDKKEGIKHLTIVKSSNLILNYFDTFSKVDLENREEWLNVLNKSENIINYNTTNWGSKTGLVADYLQKNISGYYIPVKGAVVEGDENEGDYNWNACRDPWRFSVDTIYSNNRTVLLGLVKLNRWIREKTGNIPEEIRPGYYIRDGKAGEIIGDRYGWGEDISFTAPFLISACIGQENQKWLNDLWSHLLEIPIDDEVYFGNVLKMQALIIASGNWINIQ
ncbi:glycosyl hydrolase family 8 [Haliovirga abyssi]|uniref:Licheninase n=1 Tax=Haliovirga abyssi TaxID=2996794 RepID=A0AAU9DW33_9FUSO|nr:glycosyl hydrolase family 8 [Haliovirga abyssi]BDU51594.1 licheninase [Haliovirga abyssi]